MTWTMVFLIILQKLSEPIILWVKGKLGSLQRNLIKERLQKRKRVRYNLGRRHPYVTRSEKYRKICLPYLQLLGKWQLLILFSRTVSLHKLVHLPLTAFNAHALGAVAEVAGPGRNPHLGTVLPALLSAMRADEKEIPKLAKEAAETVVLVIDEEGVESLISELVRAVSDSQASIRRSSSYLIGYFFKNCELYLVDEAPNVISTLIVLLSDSDSATVVVSWEALSRVVSSVPKEVLPSYIKLVRDAVSTSRDKERRKKKGGSIVIPGFCLPKALQPLLPIFHHGLTSGSAELREQAALGLGELNRR